MIHFPFRRAAVGEREPGWLSVATSWPRLAADHLNYHNEHRRIYLLHANTLESALGEAVKRIKIPCCTRPALRLNKSVCAPERKRGGLGGGLLLDLCTCGRGCRRRPCLSARPSVHPSCDRPTVLDLFANISIRPYARSRSRIY